MVVFCEWSASVSLRNLPRVKKKSQHQKSQHFSLLRFDAFVSLCFRFGTIGFIKTFIKILIFFVRYMTACIVRIFIFVFATLEYSRWIFASVYLSKCYLGHVALWLFWACKNLLYIRACMLSYTYFINETDGSVYYNRRKIFKSFGMKIMKNGSFEHAFCEYLQIFSGYFSFKLW